eukprot:COSAG06_NODE_52416_length_305_cov_7.470874_1_plen_61_part_00
MAKTLSLLYQYTQPYFVDTHFFPGQGTGHSGRESSSSIVDPMRLADWPMAYIGDMVPLAL